MKSIETTSRAHIGLSLGADLCWPKCYEEILRKMDLRIPHEGQNVSFEVERVTIEPYDLKQNCKYDLVIDRVTHWYHTSREWIKKSIVMDDLYVFNNPWSIAVDGKTDDLLCNDETWHAGPGNLDGASQVL